MTKVDPLSNHTRPVSLVTLIKSGLAGAASSLGVLLIDALGARLGNFPFLPYLYFDWLVRTLPGWLVVPSLERMLQVVRWLSLGPTDRVGKLFENGLALLLFLGISAVLGGLASLIRKDSLIFSTLAGLALWGITLAIEVSDPSFTTLTPLVTLGMAVLALGWTWLVVVGVSVLSIRAETSSRGYNASRRRLLAELGATGLAVFLVLAGVEQFRKRLSVSTPARINSVNGLPSAPATSPVTPLATGVPTAIPRPTPSAIPMATAVPISTNSESDSGPARLPHALGADGRILPAPGTRRELTDQAYFYRVDIDIDPPQVDPSTWQLGLDGLVESPLSLSLEQVRARPAFQQFATYTCISNTLGGKLIGTAGWTGIRLKDILLEAGLKTGASAVDFQALDGYYESAPLSEALDERALLIFAMNGVALTPEHGFPLRLYLPGHYGMKQPKWINHLRVADRLGGGFWSDRGWSQSARVNTMSSIDSADSSLLEPTTRTVPLGGIAYAGDRGITRVEIQMDGGEWLVADLRTPPLSPLTWVQWRYNIPDQPGHHTFRVRATDGNDQVQPDVITDMFPNGATGLSWKDVDF